MQLRFVQMQHRGSSSSSCSSNSEDSDEDVSNDEADLDNDERRELLCLIVTRERNDVCCTIIIPSKVDTSIKQATFKSGLALELVYKEK